MGLILQTIISYLVNNTLQSERTHQTIGNEKSHS